MIKNVGAGYIIIGEEDPIPVVGMHVEMNDGRIIGLEQIHFTDKYEVTFEVVEGDLDMMVKWIEEQQSIDEVIEAWAFKLCANLMYPFVFTN